MPKRRQSNNKLMITQNSINQGNFSNYGAANHGTQRDGHAMLAAIFNQDTDRIIGNEP